MGPVGVRLCPRMVILVLLVYSLLGAFLTHSSTGTEALSDKICLNDIKGESIVIGSIGGAAEYQGGGMGEFVKQDGDFNGRVYYKQKETVVDSEKYLFFREQSWWISDVLTTEGAKGRMRNRQDSENPPPKGWEYYVGEGEWRDDDMTVMLEFTNLASLKPCKLVRVEGDAEVEDAQGSKLGDYKIQEDRWTSGRQVYQLVNGQTKRYLLVKKGHSSWIISSSTTDSTGAWIKSGRGTLSPTDVEASGSARSGVSKWRYFVGGGGGTWKEGNIHVTCLD